MIICSCARISDRDIHEAIGWMRAADPDAVITPGRIYRALGKRPVCGGCVRLFVENMSADVNLAVSETGRRPRALRIPGAKDEG